MFYNRSQDWSISTMCNMGEDDNSLNSEALRMFCNRSQDCPISTQL